MIILHSSFPHMKVTIEMPIPPIIFKP